MDKITYMLIISAMLCACSREVPGADATGTKSATDTVPSSEGGVTISIENDGQWGGVVER